MNILEEDFATHEHHVMTSPVAQHRRQVSGKNEVDLYPKLYTLSEFIATFDLPQATRVVEGHYGTTEAETTISNGTVLLLCCQKTTKMVLTENAHKVTYSIPCDSSLMYAALDTAYGFQGHVYNSVSELLSHPDLPKVVHIDDQTASDLCLANSDRLIFPYQKEQDLLGRNCLVCYDQRDAEFKLSATKHGLFSTKPDDIKMDLHSCIKHIREFPYSVAKYNVEGGMFPITDGSILTLTGTVNKQSVMTKIMSERTGKNDMTIIEIPLDTPIMLQCLQTNLQTSESEATSGYQNASKLQTHPYTSIKPRTSLPDEYMTLSASNGPNESKQLLDASQEPLYEHLPGEGLTYDDVINQPPSAAAYDDVINQPSSMAAYDDVINQLPSAAVYDDVIDQPPSVAAYEEPQQQLERIQKLEASNKKLEASNKKLLTEVAQLQACVNELTRLIATKNPESNIKQLSSMDTDTVVIMLQAMGLSEYEDIFRDKEISGKKLAQLDRKKLSQYGITNIKDLEGLKDIIKGRVSPLVYLLYLPSSNTANSSYAHFTKTFKELNHYY